MARTQNIKSNGLTYSITLMDRNAYGDSTRQAGQIWDMGVGAAAPTAVATHRFSTVVSDETRRGAVSTTLAFIGFDFRANNTGRVDSSGRVDQPVNNVKRVMSATLSADLTVLSGIGGIGFGCIPKTDFEVDGRGDFGPTGGAMNIRKILGYEPLTRSGDGGIIALPSLTEFEALRGGNGVYEFSLKPSMLAALSRAMREKQVFGLVGMPIQLAQRSNYAAAPRVTPRDAYAIQINNATANAPILHIEYVLDNNRINTGGGLSRTTTSGFMEGNMFSGTNSGFSE
jgi:hypothetical protein